MTTQRRKRAKQSNGWICENDWLSHINHLQLGLIFTKECRICGIGIVTPHQIGPTTRESMYFYEEARISKVKSISYNEIKGANLYASRTGK